jgi:hypothetical protein
MASDTETKNITGDEHSIWNGRFKSNPKEARFFLDFLDKINKHFDGIPVDDVIQTFWGEEREVLEKLIKKANKREKKEEAKFSHKDLKKAPTANILFQRKYKEDCDKSNKKFNLKECSEAYKKLTEKDKAKYVAESQKLKDQYKADFERLRTEAIKNGDFPEDKPKRPMTAYFRYLGDVRAKLTEKHKNMADRKAANAVITKEAAAMWKELSDKDKAKYEDAYKNEKESFDVKQKAWESKETERRKRADGTPAEVKVETSGAKKAPVVTKAAPKAAEPEPEAEPVAAASDATAEAAADDAASAVASDAEVEEKPKTKAAPKAAKKAVAPVTESEGEHEVEKKPTPKAKKAAAASAESSDVEIAEVKPKSKSASSKAK